MTLMQGIIYALSVVVALFVGGYLKSYTGKKGENLATKEDIAKITQLQEEIRDQVSGERKMWELRRELAYEVATLTGTLSELFTRMLVTAEALRARTIPPEARDETISQVIETTARVKQTMESLWGLEGKVLLIFGPNDAKQIQRLINAGMAMMASARAENEEEAEQKQKDYSIIRSQIMYEFKNILDEKK